MTTIEDINNEIKIIDEKIIELEALKTKLKNDKEALLKKNDDPLISFEMAKTLTHNELKKLTFSSRSIKINMSEVKVGDYIRGFVKNDFIIGRVSRITAKTIFFYPIIENQANTIKYYEWKPYDTYTERSYKFYYNNIISPYQIHVSNEKTEEKKILIKNDIIEKAINNFVSIYEHDFGL